MVSVSNYVSYGFSERPLYLGQVFGVRSWKVENGLLASPYRPYEWDPDTTVHHATCQPYWASTVSGPYECPGLATKACDCGFFACTDLKSFDNYRLDDDLSDYFWGIGSLSRVVGVVKGYGLVVRGTKGWRASKVEIVAVDGSRGDDLDDRYRKWFVHDPIDDVARSYGVADEPPEVLK